MMEYRRHATASSFSGITSESTRFTPKALQIPPSRRVDDDDDDDRPGSKRKAVKGLLVNSSNSNGTANGGSSTAGSYSYAQSTNTPTATLQTNDPTGTRRHYYFKALGSMRRLERTDSYSTVGSARRMDRAESIRRMDRAESIRSINSRRLDRAESIRSINSRRLDRAESIRSFMSRGESIASFSTQAEFDFWANNAPASICSTASTAVTANVVAARRPGNPMAVQLAPPSVMVPQCVVKPTPQRVVYKDESNIDDSNNDENIYEPPMLVQRHSTGSVSATMAAMVMDMSIAAENEHYNNDDEMTMAGDSAAWDRRMSL